MRAATEAGMLPAMPPAHIYQILTPYVSREQLDPGFDILDNTANERPDWFEYWPIRNYLLRGGLDDSAFYGFLSPKFRLKTNLSSAAVRGFIDASDPATEVVLFSPRIDHSAYYWNVFDHGEEEHPGMKEVTRRLLGRLGMPSDLESLVSDSRNTVFSNFFIAKPRFWREWLAINERLFAIAEAADDELGAILRTPTIYRGAPSVQMKVFVMERIASLILTRDASFSVRVRDPFVAHTRIYKLPVAVICDALKIAYVTQGRGQYKDVFELLLRVRKVLNLEIRIGAALGLPHLGTCLRSLRAYWLRHDS
jgi:hypothetical protein